MAHQKRNLFAVLGWIVWKLLAIVGVPAAKKKVRQRGDERA
ncbi:hypothetical protein [Nocardioides sp.]